MTTLAFAGPALRLTSGDIEAEAAVLHCDPAVVHAVCDVESAGSGFLSDGRPKILFEAATFYKLTKGRFGQSNISSPTWDKSLYGAGGAHQYDRLAQAIALDREAALQSASWGLFQIMGMNFEVSGFDDVESFVAAMQAGENNHLDAFEKFCTANGLVAPLTGMPPDFATFARGYNGPGYAATGYDVKLAAAWRKWRAIPDPSANTAPRTDPATHYATLQYGSYGPAVTALQQRLVALGDRLSVDGDYGPATLAAVVAFQRAHKLLPDGIAGPATQAALAAA